MLNSFLTAPQDQSIGHGQRTCREGVGSASGHARTDLSFASLLGLGNWQQDHDVRPGALSASRISATDKATAFRAKMDRERRGDSQQFPKPKPTLKAAMKTAGK
jgi:hypothetical protein